MSITHRIYTAVFPAQSQAGNAADHRATLGSWKEVAAYLEVTVRTAQRWERQRGLPIHRCPGPRGRVQADPRALQAWLASALLSQQDLPIPVGSRCPIPLAHFSVPPVVTLQAPLLHRFLRRLAAYARRLAARHNVL